MLQMSGDICYGRILPFLYPENKAEDFHVYAIMRVKWVVSRPLLNMSAYFSFRPLECIPILRILSERQFYAICTGMGCLGLVLFSGLNQIDRKQN